MTGKHTPTPWTLEQEGYPEGGFVISDVKNGFTICHRESWPNRGRQSLANAALIVRAVNAHEALVKALQRLSNETGALLKMFEPEIRAETGYTNFGCIQGAVEKADAALALARETP